MKKQQKTGYFESTTKPSLFSGIIPKSQNLFSRNKANLNSTKFIATPCNIGGYNDLHPKIQNGTKPIKANFFTTPKPHFSAELFSGILTITKKPYFAKRTQFQKGKLHLNCGNDKGLQQITLQWTTEKRTQSKPNTNPIRTQFEPNSNPKQTQSKPNFAPTRRKNTHWVSEQIPLPTAYTSCYNDRFELDNKITGELKCVKDVVAASNTLRNRSLKS